MVKIFNYVLYAKTAKTYKPQRVINLCVINITILI